MFSQRSVTQSGSYNDDPELVDNPERKPLRSPVDYGAVGAGAANAERLAKQIRNLETSNNFMFCMIFVVALTQIMLAYCYTDVHNNMVAIANFLAKMYAATPAGLAQAQAQAQAAATPSPQWSHWDDLTPDIWAAN